MTADLSESVFLVVELDDLAAGGGTEAVTVGNHQSAAVLNELGEAGVVHLGADYSHAGAEGADGIGLSLLQLCQSLAELGENEVLGAGVGDQVEHVELVTGDDGVFGLTHLADLADDAADLVMLLNSLADGSVGGINTVDLGEPVQNAQSHLLDVGLECVVGDLVGHVGMGDEEAGLLADTQNFKVLHSSVHHGAGVNTDHCVQKLIAALYAALHQCSGKLAGVV